MDPITRQQAREQGLSFYFTGQPCKRGHLAPRKVASANCCQCANDWHTTEAGKAYYSAYNSSEEGRERTRRYARTEKRKVTREAHRVTPKARATKAAYIKTPKAVSTRAARHKWRMENDPLYAATQYLRVSLASRLRRQKASLTASSRAVKYLGCTLPEFMTYIEGLWEPGMKWSDHGKLWHLDHIKPLALFDLTDPTKLFIAGHYTNLQPLSTEAHKIKTAKDTAMILAQRKAL